MVWEYKSSTIVMLAKEKEGPKVHYHYGADSTVLFVLKKTKHSYSVQTSFFTNDNLQKNSKLNY